MIMRGACEHPVYKEERALRLQAGFHAETGIQAFHGGLPEQERVHQRNSP